MSKVIRRRAAHKAARFYASFNYCSGRTCDIANSFNNFNLACSQSVLHAERHVSEAGVAKADEKDFKSFLSSVRDALRNIPNSSLICS